jgi:membrane protein DedA with SNARE-associated domain
MNETLQFLSRHGYLVVLGWVFAEQAGIPVPALPILLTAGALVGMGRMNPGAVWSMAIVGALASDFLWFELGRKRGIRVLQFLCRVSMEPDSCVRNTQGVFARHGARSLLVAKFVPGLGAAAAPLAGVVKMPPARFLLCDLAGIAIWSGAYLGLGFVFSDQLERVALAGSRLGATLFLLLALALGGFVVSKYVRRQHFLHALRQARITPEELRAKLDAGEDVLVVDLRHLLTVEADPELIPGAKWIDPDRLDQEAREIPRNREVILYCA